MTEYSLQDRSGDPGDRSPDTERQKRYFGRLVDHYIRTGSLASARALCQEIIRIAPEVVRAHCTMALLALVEGDWPEFEREVNGYVAAARAAGTEQLAVSRLRALAAGPVSAHVLRVLGRGLQELEAEEASSECFSRARDLERLEVAPQRRIDPQFRAWLLRAALMGPQDLWDPR